MRPVRFARRFAHASKHQAKSWHGSAKSNELLSENSAKITDSDEKLHVHVVGGHEKLEMERAVMGIVSAEEAVPDDVLKAN